MRRAHFVESSLDDAMRVLLCEMLNRGDHIVASKGSNRELTGVLLELTNPRARLSRTETRGRLFSCLGELCWYLAKDNSLAFIEYYISDYANYAENDILYGAYGPRLFNWHGSNQFCNVQELLQKRQSSRRAVIQLFHPDDILTHHEDVPCTSTLQFLVRENQLHLIATMRSNDLYKGFPHDIFCFTMLQEIMARTLDIEIGTYRHFVGSLHLYEAQEEAAQRFLDEGWQQTDMAMPQMPEGNPWPAIAQLLEAENALRTNGVRAHVDIDDLAPYWADLVRLLHVFGCLRGGETERIAVIRNEIAFQGYRTFIDRRYGRLRSAETQAS